MSSDGKMRGVIAMQRRDLVADFIGRLLRTINRECYNEFELLAHGIQFLWKIKPNAIIAAHLIPPMFPRDIWLEVLIHLTLFDMVQISRTCRSLYAVARLAIENHQFIQNRRLSGSFQLNSGNSSIKLLNPATMWVMLNVERGMADCVPGYMDATRRSTELDVLYHRVDIEAENGIDYLILKFVARVIKIVLVLDQECVEIKICDNCFYPRMKSAEYYQISFTGCASCRFAQAPPRKYRAEPDSLRLQTLVGQFMSEMKKL